MTTTPAATILSGQTQRIASVTANPFVSKLAKVTVVATFILLVAGALVTGNKAAMADPTWPLFVGSWFPKYFTGGLLYEDSHRLIAATVGILTLLLAIVVQWKDVRRSIKKLGWFAFALVIAQALIGGLIIHSIRNPWVSMFHGVVAQTFFCTVLALAVYTSPRWVREFDLPLIHRPQNAGYLKLWWIAVGLAFAQVVLGTGVRHSADHFLPFLITHIATALGVVFASGWLTLRTFGEYRALDTLRRSTIMVVSLLGLQVVLGILSIYANRARLEPEMAHWWDVFVSTAHLANGALILAVLFTTTLRARRVLAVDEPEQLSTTSPRPGAA